MSMHRCEICEEIYDADYVGCEEYPTNKYALICEGCAEDIGCYYCGKHMPATSYCKITNLYYHEGCAL